MGKFMVFVAFAVVAGRYVEQKAYAYYTAPVTEAQMNAVIELVGTNTLGDFEFNRAYRDFKLTQIEFKKVMAQYEAAEVEIAAVK